MKLLILNGPNLNMLGIREPEIYGNKTYKDLEDYITSICKDLKVEYEVFQSNHEGVLIDKIQSAYSNCDGIVINPAGYTHTSVAVLDALKAVGIPFCEVHLSDVSKREEFRQISYIRPYALESYIGLGFSGYKKAIERLYENYNNIERK